MLGLLLSVALAQGAPSPARAAWAAQVSDDGAAEKVFAAIVTPLPKPKLLRLELYPPGGQPRQVDFDAGQNEWAMSGELRDALVQSNATLLVLTLDTLITYDQGRAALNAVYGTPARVELRFAGPTKVKGQAMPEVLKLAKELPAPPALTREQVRAVLQTAYPKVRECYTRQLEENALEGKLEVELELRGDGSVQSAGVIHTELSAREVEQCVVEVVKALKFPKLRGQQTFTVHWPFLFKKGEDKAPPPPIRK